MSKIAEQSGMNRPSLYTQAVFTKRISIFVLSLMLKSRFERLFLHLNVESLLPIITG